MRHSFWHRPGAVRLMMAGVLAWGVSGVLVSTAPQSHSDGPRVRVHTASSAVTPVSGRSHLHRLGLKLHQSAMGWTGRLGPAPEAGVIGRSVATSMVQPAQVVLTGADLYRLNCRACHRQDGRGAPDEVRSLIDPIRATSPDVLRRRMEALGRPVGLAFANTLAAESRADILERLAEGGEKMPAFGHLSRVEVDALLAYLEWLAGIPGAERRQIRVVSTPVRVGEHLVKGTCHICHDASGRWPGPEALLDGERPSLASLAEQRTLNDVVTKVRDGKPVIMGAARMLSRGRMPVFDYLTEAEVAGAYAYLVAYPPESAGDPPPRVSILWKH